MAGNQPFPVTGIIYEQDESTVIESSTLYAYNITKDESTTGDTNSLGEFAVDLGEMESQWEVGDEVHIKVWTSDNRLGVFRFIISTGQMSLESNITVDVVSDVENLLVNHYDSVTIRDTTISVDTYGHSSTGWSNYLVYGVAQINSSNQEDVKFGVLQLGDLTVFVSGNDYNKKYAKAENLVYYDGLTYKIQNIVKKRSVHGGGKWSHYELYCKRIS